MSGFSFTIDLTSAPSFPHVYTIKTKGSYTYSYTVDWGAGEPVDSMTYTGNATHSYNTAGPHTVIISGTFPSPDFLNDSFLVDINDWGTGVWEDFDSSFRNCTGITTFSATNTPTIGVSPTPGVSCHSMFYDATNFNSNINNWNVSNVYDLSIMFFSATSFNQPLNSWDVSNVTKIYSMFQSATSFNQPLNSWDVSSITDMGSMFQNATSFNQPLNSWNVSSVTLMGSMFLNATSFNQNLHLWDVSSVALMSGMFLNATSFNQPLNSWDVSNVTNMSGMFQSATSFNQPLNSWDVSSVALMSGMFQNATSFNQNLHLWDVSTILSEPTDFKTGTDPCWSGNPKWQPKWGTTPTGTGNLFLGNSTPDNLFASDGDYFVNVDTNQMYKKETGVWEGPTDITGASDLIFCYDDPQAVPLDGVGAQDNYYFDVNANIIYGPKGAVSWTSPGQSFDDFINSIITPPTTFNTLRYGANDPTTEGNDGDFYINTTSNTIFGPKGVPTPGIWPAGTSLIGPTGATGSAGTVWILEARAPLATDGAEGNYFIDSTTGNIWGPKTMSGWPSKPILDHSILALASSGNTQASLVDDIINFVSQYWKEFIIVTLIALVFFNIR